jgi:bacillithiol system protein YtxJ
VGIIKSLSMGIFSGLFGGSKSIAKEKRVLPWIPLNSTDQFDGIVEASKVKPQVIFKFSTRCGISSMVLNQFVDNYDLSTDDLDLHFLDLINYRNVSNEVGYKFQIIHESPQLLVIKNGAVVAHGSHSGVNAIDLNSFV